MRIAVLPFNAGPDTRPALARQFANFASEIARNASPDAQVDAVNYMGQIQEDGVPKFVLINPSDTVNDDATLSQFFKGEVKVDALVDGLLTENSAGGGTLKVRVVKGDAEIASEEDFTYLPGGEFGVVRSLVETILAETGGSLPAEMDEDDALFGTSDAQAFLKFLQGYDALKYIEQSQGNVPREFDPQAAIDTLQEAVQMDREWEAPYLVLVQFCRACLTFRVGNAQMVEGALKRLIELEPDDHRAIFALGELYTAVGNHQGASDQFEKCVQMEPEEPAILHRLAISQLHLGMPVNAERNLRKAVEMEGDDKPSLDLLSDVLAQTGRGHEVPELWNDIIKKDAQNGKAHARYAMSLIASGRKDEGLKAFEDALVNVEDTLLIKRFYAPILRNENDFDRAMDFYEDFLDEQGGDVGTLLEYADTLRQADREFEIPDVLKQAMGLNPDPNTRANILAWLIELEQPKRVQAVQDAAAKAEQGDFQAALDDLAPMKNWLGDYWKMWIVMASAQNQLEKHEDAEQSARRALEIFPTLEPGYVELNNALAGQEKHDEAFQLMQIALGNMPNSLPIAISYALAAKRAGNPEEGKRIARQIREAVPDLDEGIKAVLDELD